MLLETFAFAALGVAIGTFAGVMPGMHINTLVPLLLSLSAFAGSPLNAATLIVSVSITEMFLNQIPAIFVGAPDADTAMSVLPGHRLLSEGRGYEAVKLTVIGGLGSLMLSLVFIAAGAGTFSFLYELSRPYMHFVIAAVVAFIILSEKEPRKMASAALVLLLSGMLGVLVLNSSVLRQQDALLPVFSGLFGLAGMIVSFNESSSAPPQSDNDAERLGIPRMDIAKSIVFASFAGILVGFLPAVGVSEAAVLTQYLGGPSTARGFLVTTAGINIANDAFSLMSLYLVGNPRSGASVAVQKIIGELTLYDVVFLVGVMLAVAGLAAWMTLRLGRTVPKLLARVHYKTLTSAVMLFITSIVFAITGASGLLVLFTSASIGMLCNTLGVRRSHCMGVLLVQTMMFFAGLNPIIISILNIQ